MQLAPISSDSRVYHSVGTSPMPTAARAQLTPMAFPMTQDRLGGVSAKHDHSDGEVEHFGFEHLADVDGARPTFRAGTDFNAAVVAARLVSETTDEEEEGGAVAVLQALDGTYFLSRPTFEEDGLVAGLYFDRYDGSQVRPESRMIKALVLPDEWVDLRV